MEQPKNIYRERREKLLALMGEGAAVFASAPVAIRNNTVEYDYRQDSDFYYLTGFEEPDSALVLTNKHAEHRSILFVRPRDPAREAWDGPRVGVEGAVEACAVDAAFSIDDLRTKLPDYLSNVQRLHHRLGKNRAFDDEILNAIQVVRGRSRTGVSAPTEIVTTETTLHEMRLRKAPDEIALMRHAAGITRDAHAAAVRTARPGRYEYEVEAELLRAFRARGSMRAAYGSIVGSGVNATILHYRRNDRRLEDGELLLIDAGCEYGYYASDVTRTFPVSGRFSPEQRAVYEIVLAAQAAAIATVKSGITLDDVHDAAVRVLVQGMIELGWLEGTLDACLESGDYKRYYMHRTSHWLGMDVHDVGVYFQHGKARALEPGFVITVEPGIYVSPNAEVAERWRGIGVRIEDDVLITDSGSENLTESIPKSVDDLEAALSSRV